MTVESLILECLLHAAVLLAKSALSVVILLRSLLQLQLRCRFQARHRRVTLQRRCGTQAGVRQSLEQSVARRLFCRQAVHLMVGRYFGHVDLTKFLEVVILVGRFVVIAALFGPSDSADTEETM